MSDRKLEWGQTPWDDMTKRELLLEIWRMYSAIVALNCSLNMSKIGADRSPYWGIEGSGGIALEKARQILDPIHEHFDDEQMYHCFFRYAADLLFDRSEYRIGFGWSMCPKCGWIVGETMNGESQNGKYCLDVLYSQCDGVLRPLQWTDLRKDIEEKCES